MRIFFCIQNILSGSPQKWSQNWVRANNITTTHAFVIAALRSFSSPEAGILLVSTDSRDLWPVPTPEVRNSQTHCQIWQIWLAENYRKNLLRMLRNWDWPEVLILGADQKDRGLWGRECIEIRIVGSPRGCNYYSVCRRGDGQNFPRDSNNVAWGGGGRGRDKVFYT